MEGVLGAIRLVGGFSFAAHGTPVALRGSGERLVAFLALNRGLVERHRLAGCFWGDKPDARALGNLRAVLWRMPLGPGEPIQTSGSRVGLAPDVQVDLDGVNAVLARVSQGDVRSGDSDTVGDAASGDLLPGWYDDWVNEQRERFRQRMLHGLDAIGEECIRQERYGEAIEAGLRSVTLEPLREAGHHVLIRAHLAEGNRSEARRQFLVLTDVLHREMGVTPSPTITAEVHAALAA